MTPLHIVMIGVPAHGHMNPHLPVLAELVARGHRVEVTTPSGFAPAVAGTGAAVVPVTSLLPDEDRGETWPDDPVAGMARFLDEGIHVLPQAHAALDDDRPDVLLGDIGSYPARVLAHRWSRPFVQLSPTYVAWVSYEQDMAEILDGLHAAPGYAAYHERFAAWLAAEDVPVEVNAFTGRPPRSVVLIPRAMQPHADDVDPRRYTFVGPALALRAHQEQWPVMDRPVLLVSLGSAYSAPPTFYRACLDAFADLDREVVVKVGPAVDPDRPAPGATERVRAPLGAAALAAGARVGVRHPRGHGRMLGGTVARRPDGGGATGGGPVRQRRPARRAGWPAAPPGRGRYRSGRAGRPRRAGVQPDVSR
jgi:MGT family glycosyltransferase